MITFKGFNKGLECRGYHFKPYEENRCDAAKTVREGFHSAENPLDTLTYYSDPAKAEYWICEVSGDIDEDAIDSKVASTVITPRVKIELDELIWLGLDWLRMHRDDVLTWNRYQEHKVANYGYAIAVGKNPTAIGKKGDVLGMMRTTDGKIACRIVGEDGIEPGKMYDIDWNEVRT